MASSAALWLNWFRFELVDWLIIALLVTLSADFPLRGACLCPECDKPMTSCWSKGRNKLYPYYYCITKGCSAKKWVGYRGHKNEDLIHTLKSEKDKLARQIDQLMDRLIETDSNFLINAYEKRIKNWRMKRCY